MPSERGKPYLVIKTRWGYWLFVVTAFAVYDLVGWLFGLALKHIAWKP